MDAYVGIILGLTVLLCAARWVWMLGVIVVRVHAFDRVPAKVPEPEADRFAALRARRTT